MANYLYVKTHNITQLKYLGKTTSNPYTYKGSGKYWKRHIKVHGNDVTTEILGTYETNEQLKEAGLYYSSLWNIVKSDHWANLKPEEGDGGGFPHSLETRQKMSSSHKGLRLGCKFSEEHKQKLSKKKQKTWLVTTPTNHILTIQNLHQFCQENNLDTSNMARLGRKPYRKTYKGWKCQII